MARALLSLSNLCSRHQGTFLGLQALVAILACHSFTLQTRKVLFKILLLFNYLELQYWKVQFTKIISVQVPPVKTDV